MIQDSIAKKKVQIGVVPESQTFLMVSVLCASYSFK